MCRCTYVIPQWVVSRKKLIGFISDVRSKLVLENGFHPFQFGTNSNKNFRQKVNKVISAIAFFNIFTSCTLTLSSTDLEAQNIGIN